MFDFGDGDIQISARGGGKLKDFVRARFPINAPLRVTIVTNRQGLVRIFLNGRKFGETRSVELDAFTQNNRIRLGCAFAERYWEGRILQCKVFSGSGLNKSVLFNEIERPDSVYEVFNVTRSESHVAPAPVQSPSLRESVKYIVRRIPLLRRHLRR